MRMTRIALLALAICGLAVAAQAAVWDVVGDFSTTTPQVVKDGAYWEYGYVSRYTALYTPFEAGQTVGLGGDPGAVTCWGTGDWTTSSIIGVNTYATRYTDGSSWLDPGQMLVHQSPGATQPAVIRFWALRPMTITLTATFSGQTYSDFADPISAYCTVGALRNGAGSSIGLIDGFAGGGDIAAFGPTPVFTFSETWTMAEGDHYDFISVAANGRGSFQGIGFAATITEVPEPCTMFALAAGLGGLIIRRRRA